VEQWCLGKRKGISRYAEAHLPSFCLLFSRLRLMTALPPTRSQIQTRFLTRTPLFASWLPAEIFTSSYSMITAQGFLINVSLDICQRGI